MKDEVSRSAVAVPLLNRKILASVREFVGTAPQSDDLTVTIVRF